MKAGKKLDILVAEKVMGWKKIQLSPPKRDLDWMWDKLEGCLAQNCQTCPNYSTDISVAWQVVEKFLPHFRLECNDLSDYVEPEDKKRWHCDIWVAGKAVCCVSADTAPEAICLAALKAVK